MVRVVGVIGERGWGANLGGRVGLAGILGNTTMSHEEHRARQGLEVDGGVADKMSSNVANLGAVGWVAMDKLPHNATTTAIQPTAPNFQGR